jgi:hypothetical protein
MNIVALAEAKTGVCKRPNSSRLSNTRGDDDRCGREQARVTHVR